MVVNHLLNGMILQAGPDYCGELRIEDRFDESGSAAGNRTSAFNQHKVVVFPKELYLKGDYVCLGGYILCVCVCVVLTDDSENGDDGCFQCLFFGGEGAFFTFKGSIWNFTLRS